MIPKPLPTSKQNKGLSYCVPRTAALPLEPDWAITESILPYIIGCWSWASRTWQSSLLQPCWRANPSSPWASGVSNVSAPYTQWCFSSNRREEMKLHQVQCTVRRNRHIPSQHSQPWRIHCLCISIWGGWDFVGSKEKKGCEEFNPVCWKATQNLLQPEKDILNRMKIRRALWGNLFSLLLAMFTVKGPQEIKMTIKNEELKVRN